MVEQFAVDENACCGDRFSMSETVLIDNAAAGLDQRQVAILWPAGNRRRGAAEVESIKSRLIDLGYSEERGRPRAGQKALKPALSLVLGLGRSQTTAVLGASRKGADTSTFSHKDLEISAAKGLKKAVSKFGAALVGQRGAKATEKRIALEAVQEAVAELLKLVEGEEK